MAQPYNYFAEQLEYVNAVLKMLNSNPLPENSGEIFLKVEVVDDTGNKFGYFSDEIAPDCWYYQPTNPLEKS